MHQWVWLNMHCYSWICLNILENVWINCSNYARVLNMPDHLMFDWLLKMPPVLNKVGFWIWHGCICKRYAEFRVSDYDSINLNNPWVCLNMPYCPSICLNMTDYCWIPSICLNKLFWLCQSSFLFDYNDVKAFKVFKWTDGYIFKCETTKMKLAKSIRKIIFLCNVIFYEILVI